MWIRRRHLPHDHGRMSHRSATACATVGLTLLCVSSCTPPISTQRLKSSDRPLTLDALLSCADRAAGGDSLRPRAAVSYDIDIVEPAFHAVGHYRATRSGTARIDIFVDGTRVFSEGWEHDAGWDQRGGDALRRVAIPPASGSALQHGIEQPGHLWTLADMTRNGHATALAGRDTVDGVVYYIVLVTLADGFRNWYWVHPTSCLVERNRNFRAFHPDADSTRKWTETRFSDFRTTHGITKAWLSTNVEVPSAKVLGTTRVLSLQYDDTTTVRTAPARP